MRHHERARKGRDVLRSLLLVWSFRVKDMLKGARRPIDRGRPIRRLTEIAPVFTASQGQGHFYGLNVCVLPAKFICWNLVPHVILLEFGDLVKWGGHESPWMGLVPLNKRPQGDLCPSCLWEHGEKTLWTRKLTLPRNWTCWYLVGLACFQNCEK